MPRTWIFQANPQKYRIEESLRVEQKEMWNLRQHSKEVQPGDRVLIWMSGKDAGIYAIGEVLTMPTIESDSPQGMQYWKDQWEGRRARPRVWVQYRQLLLQRPLLRSTLICDPDLENLSILRYAQGTNFPVTEAEWSRIQFWLNT